MTTQKSFKRRVRARMARTGESYTAARRQLVPRPPAPSGTTPTGTRKLVDSTSDEALRGRTGRGWDEWFAILDGWNATTRTHTEIATWLVEQHAVDGWWAQSITVGYEQERGMRMPGQRSDGTYSANASKTIAAGVDRLYAAFADPALRGQWLDAELVPRGKSTQGKIFRAQLAGTPGKVACSFTAKGEAKAVVAIEHSKLPDARAAADLKQAWRDRLVKLKDYLQG